MFFSALWADEDQLVAAEEVFLAVEELNVLFRYHFVGAGQSYVDFSHRLSLVGEA
jgi:hypothetical protein